MTSPKGYQVLDNQVLGTDNSPYTKLAGVHSFDTTVGPKNNRNQKKPQRNKETKNKEKNRIKTTEGFDCASNPRLLQE